MAARQQAEAKAQEASEARQQASHQRDLARERLYESLVREAGSVRKARQIGYRREVFDLLKQAVALGTTNVDNRLVRREAAACLGDWVGLDPVDIALPGDVGTGALTKDGALAAIATWDGKISLRETRTGREAALLEVGGNPYSLAFDQRGLSLFIATAKKHDFIVGVRTKSVQLEKWSARRNGSWEREWARPADGFTQFVPTTEGLVALILGPADSYLAVWDAEREVEVARVPVPVRVA